jgi:excisionase family DNA binding protein
MTRKIDKKEVINNKIFDNYKQEILTASGVAEYLKISKSEVYNLCSLGKIRYFKIGRRSRFLKSDLDELLFANARGGQQ